MGRAGVDDPLRRLRVFFDQLKGASSCAPTRFVPSLLFRDLSPNNLLIRGADNTFALRPAYKSYRNGAWLFFGRDAIKRTLTLSAEKFKASIVMIIAVICPKFAFCLSKIRQSFLGVVSGRLTRSIVAKRQACIVPQCHIYRMSWR